MRTLYCAMNVFRSSSGSNDLEAEFLDRLRNAGHEVSSVIGSSDDVLVSELGRGNRTGYKSSTASISAEEPPDPLSILLSELSDLVTHRQFDLIIVRGVALNEAVTSAGISTRDKWCFLTDEDVTSESDHAGLTAVVDDSDAVLVAGRESLKAVKAASPAVRHKIVALDSPSSPASGDRGIGAGLVELTARTAATFKVLLYVDSPGAVTSSWLDSIYTAATALASDSVHVTIMCQDGVKAFRRVMLQSHNVAVIEPRCAPHQLADGRLLPRFAAWHVAAAANELGASAVLTDDLETVVYGFSNNSLLPRLWPVIKFADEVEFQEQRDAFEKISETVSRLVFGDHDSRAIFESRIFSATSKTIVLPNFLSATTNVTPQTDEKHLNELFRAYLDRSVADYRAVPKMPSPCRVVLAGHDFKFAGELIDVLVQREDIDLRVDHWAGQNIQDLSTSNALLAWADVILCEFASHNAVWYSWEKLPGQTLIVRFHGYELWSPWIQNINLSNVDKILFVSKFYRDKVVEELGWPLHKTEVMPNVVDTLDLARPKAEGSRFHIGMAGIVPILKRPDRALDLLEGLLREDPRYTLHIRGRAPWEYGWMWKDPDIRDAYMAFYERLAMNPRLRRRVAFDDFGPDMGRWFQNIGWVLSPSFRETFHLAPVEGMASGAVPVVWAREGAAEVFRADWVHDDTAAAIRFILETNADASEHSKLSREAIEESKRYDVVANGRAWLELILGTEGSHSYIPSLNINTDSIERIFAEAPTAQSLRWLIGTLIRDGRKSRISELVAEHRGYAAEMPPSLLFENNWERGIKALKDNYPQVPERASGAAFLPRRGAVMVAVNPDRVAEAACNVDDAEASCLGELRLVALASSVTDPLWQAGDASRRLTEMDHMTMVDLTLSNTNALGLDEYIQVAADALVREARAFRPSAIAAQQDFWVSIPALVAARRLGIPFIMERGSAVSGRGDAELSARARDEADAMFDRDISPLHVLDSAISAYGTSTALRDTRTLGDLSVGVIADEFTSRTIAHSFKTTPLSRQDGYLQVASTEFDAIFVESAWEGPGDEWRRGVAFHADRIDDLERIIRTAKARNIPVIFWNKEDPVHFKAFEKTAAMIDHVFTTDADMIGSYLRSDSSVAISVSSLPFYAEPKIHNPLPTDRPYSHTVSYAGTYYGDRFRKRSEELHRILESAKPYGLTIYDRQVNVENSPYRFPPDLADFVREGVPYGEVLEVYKSHPLSINVNSADDSPTMFSRRVVEVAASGSVVLSGRGRGIVEQLQGIEATDSSDRWAELLRTWMLDENARRIEAWSQMRTIARSHLAQHSLTIMMRTAGIPVTVKNLPAYAVVSRSLDESLVGLILQQTWLPSAVFSDDLPDPSLKLLRERGIDVFAYSQHLQTQADWLAFMGDVPSETYFEDLLHATRFGDWTYISARQYDRSEGVGVPIIELERNGTYAHLSHIAALTNPVLDCPLTWIMPAPTK